jgi:diguanylate cyclase (GGDEF)-like protein
MSTTPVSADSLARHLRDKLTGALCRPHFLDLLAEEKRFADRSGQAFLLCLLDVDQLRSINDAAGLRAGDEVLRGIANSLRDILDTAPWDGLNYLHARFDGDALMVLLRCCRVEQGQRLAETVRVRVRRSTYRADARATVSAAVASYAIGEPIDRVLSRTERTLLLAKQAGGDCVETALLPADHRTHSNVIYLPGVVRAGFSDLDAG